jgi:hypothetical protein
MTMPFRLALVLCSLAAAAAQSLAPAHTVTLHSPQLEVLLNRDSGLPDEYRLLSNQATIHGAEAGHAIAATICDIQSHKFQKVTATPQTVRAASTRGDFLFALTQDSRPAASFTLFAGRRGIRLPREH